MSTAPQIETVQNNHEKYLNYRSLMGRYKKAVSEGFYFEALLIDYAMLEDRLKSFLYHIGAVNLYSYEMSIPASTSAFYKEIYGKITAKNLKNIGVKIELIRSVLKWAETDDEIEENRKYPAALKKHCRRQLNFTEFLEKLDELDHWRDSRNDIIHALMNKRYQAVSEQSQEIVLKGMELARYIDRQTDNIRKWGYIRKSMEPVRKE